MMKLLTAVLLLVVVTVNADRVFRAGPTIDYINYMQTTWKAGVNPWFEGRSKSQIRKLMGVIIDEEHRKVAALPKLEYSEEELKAIPDSFDARTAWPNCADVIGNIRDQSACGSCWAVAAAGAMSDRICVASNGKNKFSISSTDLMACCYMCGHGCEGGYPSEAWAFAKSTGIVTGGAFNTTGSCEPYAFPKCEHHNSHTTYPACPSALYPTPKCTKKCQPGYTPDYKDDKKKATSHYGIHGVENIQKAIMEKGPVEVSFNVYEDFLAYKSGVYQHKTGGYDGGHAVRAIGWGTEEGTGVPYWIIANSWNEDWGDKGYFKIIRGKNECGIESGVVAGDWPALF